MLTGLTEKKFKLKLGKDKHLRLYMFLVNSSDDVSLPGVELLYGYDLSATLDKVTTHYSNGSYEIDHLGSMPVETLLTPIEGFITEAEEKKPDVNMNKKGFVLGLKYMNDKLKGKLTRVEKSAISRAITKLEKTLKVK